MRASAGGRALHAPRSDCASQERRHSRLVSLRCGNVSESLIGDEAAVRRWWRSSRERRGLTLSSYSSATSGW